MSLRPNPENMVKTLMLILHSEVEEVELHCGLCNRGQVRLSFIK